MGPRLGPVSAGNSEVGFRMGRDPARADAVASGQVPTWPGRARAQSETVAQLRKSTNSAEVLMLDWLDPVAP